MIDNCTHHFSTVTLLLLILQLLLLHKNLLPKLTDEKDDGIRLASSGRNVEVAFEVVSVGEVFEKLQKISGGLNKIERVGIAARGTLGVLGEPIFGALLL